jgi:hypothetical protein
VSLLLEGIVPSAERNDVTLAATYTPSLGTPIVDQIKITVTDIKVNPVSERYFLSPTGDINTIVNPAAIGIYDNAQIPLLYKRFLPKIEVTSTNVVFQDKEVYWSAEPDPNGPPGGNVRFRAVLSNGQQASNSRAYGEGPNATGYAVGRITGRVLLTVQRGFPFSR